MNVSDIKNKTFSNVRKGYDCNEVKTFLDEVCQQLKTLQTEKAEMETKLGFLANKVEDYKKDEESIRDALLGAQKLGKTILVEAKDKATQMLTEAEDKSKNMIESAETLSVQSQKKSQTFAQDLIVKAKQEAEKLIVAARMESEQIMKDNKATLLNQQQILIAMQKDIDIFKSSLLETYSTHIKAIEEISQTPKMTTLKADITESFGEPEVDQTPKTISESIGDRIKDKTLEQQKELQQKREEESSKEDETLENQDALEVESTDEKPAETSENKEQVEDEVQDIEHIQKPLTREFEINVDDENNPLVTVHAENRLLNNIGGELQFGSRNK